MLEDVCHTAVLPSLLNSIVIIRTCHTTKCTTSLLVMGSCTTNTGNSKEEELNVPISV